MRTLTEILGLSLELKDYEDRVQKRYNYIQEQLKLNPEFVAYDYLEYFYALNDSHYLFNQALISTTGLFYKFKDGEWLPSSKGNKETYLRKSFHDNKQNKTVSFQTHRAVASTFIPKSEHLADIPFWQLEVNHKDGDKHNPNISNLEWMTKSENTQHALENGLQKRGFENNNSKSVLGTVEIEGPYKGMCFKFTGRYEFAKHGMTKSRIIICLNNKRIQAYGCKWKEIDKQDYEINNNDKIADYLLFLKENRKIASLKIKPILITVVDGYYKGFKYCLFGCNKGKEYGFDPGTIRTACIKGKIYRKSLWEYIGVEQAIKYTEGIPENVLSTLTIK